MMLTLMVMEVRNVLIGFVIAVIIGGGVIAGVGQDDVEAACSGGGRDSLPPVTVSLCREMLLYLQAVKNDDAKEAFKHYRGAFR